MIRKCFILIYTDTKDRHWIQFGKYIPYVSNDPQFMNCFQQFVVPFLIKFDTLDLWLSVSASYIDSTLILKHNWVANVWENFVFITESSKRMLRTT